MATAFPMPLPAPVTIATLLDGVMAFLSWSPDACGERAV